MPIRNIWAGGSSWQMPRVPNAPAYTRPFQASSFYQTPGQGGGSRQPNQVDMNVFGQKRELDTNFFERLEYNALPAIGWSIRQPAVIAERPVAALDVVTGGAVRKGLEAIGNAGGSNGDPGPIGGFFKGIGDVLGTVGNSVSALFNSQDANILKWMEDKPDSTVIPEWLFGTHRVDGGLLGFFGLGGRQMTKADFLANINKRGFFTGEDGQQLTVEDVYAKAKSDPFGFGYARVNDSPVVDFAFRAVTDPTNLAFFIPGGAFVKGAEALGRVGAAARAGTEIVAKAAWARPMVTMATTTRGFGYGFIKDMAAAGLRATKLPSAVQSSRAILSGSVANGSLKGLAKAMSSAQRGTLSAARKTFLPGLDLRSAEELKALGRSGLSARALQAHEVARAYTRGSLRIQLGSMAVEGGSGAAEDWLSDNIGDENILTGLASAIHTTAQKINNDHPLSDNETFILMSAVAMPVIPVAGEYLGFTRAGIHRLVGDNDAVVFAKSLVPDLDKQLTNLTKNAQVDEMYSRFGNGDIAKGKQVFQFMIDYLDTFRAWKELASANRKFVSMDELAAHGAALAPIIEKKVAKMRAMGRVNAKGRLNEMWDLIRHGDDNAERSFTFNATEDAVIDFWAREFEARSRYTSKLREYGDFSLTQATYFTREMGEDMLRIIDSEKGIVDRDMMSDLLMRFPGLLDKNAPRRDFWARFATQAEDLSGGKNVVENRVTYEELRDVLQDMVGGDKPLPTNEELFWEAAKLEKSAPADAELVKPLRRYTSLEQIRQVKEDAIGRQRALRRDEHELVNIRNTEFTRNGKPKYETMDHTVGYDGTVFHKIKSPTEGAGTPDGFEFNMGENVVYLHPDGRITFKNGFGVNTPSSEAIVKMTQLGGRVIEYDASHMSESLGNLAAGEIGPFLAKHGYREVAKLSDKHRFYAYVGGSVNDLPNRLTNYPMPAHFHNVDIPGVTRGINVSDDMQMVSFDKLEKYIEIDRETTPKVAGDTAYLDELTETIKKSGHMEPIELTFNQYLLAIITDGNHRMAVARRLGYKEVPVVVKFDPTLNYGRDAGPIGGGNIVTAAELVQDPKPMLPDYRPTKRIVKSQAGGISLAKKRADAASITVPQGDILGPAPVGLEGQFHGSPSEFEAFDNAFRNANDLIGAGVFMTDALDIAEGYARSGLYYMRNNLGHIYRVKPKEGAKLFDLHQPMPENVRKLAVENLERYVRPNLTKYTQTIDNVGTMFDDMRNAPWEVTLTGESADVNIAQIKALADRAQAQFNAIVEAGDLPKWALGDSVVTEKYIKADPYGTLMKEAMRLYEAGESRASDVVKAWADVLAKHSQTIAEQSLAPEIINMAADPNLSAWDLYTYIYREGEAMGDLNLGEFNNAIRNAFQREGYEGFTHTGGLIAGDGQRLHNVTIMFDANDVQMLGRVSAKDIVPHTKARFQQITDRLNRVRELQKAARAEMKAIERRAEELRVIKLDDAVLEHVAPEKQQELRELVQQIREEYPMYDVEYRPGFHYDPADGPLPGMNLERNLARHVLYDYGPLSRVAALWHGLFDPISSKAQSAAARQAVFNLTLPMGAKVKDVERVLSRLNARQREQTVGALRVPWFRDITSLPANQVNSVARQIFDEATWAKIEAKYGENGFHHLLDEAANEFVRTFDTKVARGEGNGALTAALRNGYKAWSYAPVTGSVSRLVSKQFYHIFRFMLDLRWHFLNIVEADILATMRSGISRFGAKDQRPGTNQAALFAHTTAEGLPAGIARSQARGPAAATELFDSGLYLHNANLLPVLMKDFEKSRLASVDKVLDQLPVEHPVIRALTDRFGEPPNRKSWSQALDDMMYDFDSKGVKQTVLDEFKKIADAEGWGTKERSEFMDVVERISELNQRAYDDLIYLYQGNLNRSRLERLLNSYWMYWPISYQIKASKWLFDVMYKRMGGRDTNLAGAYLVNRQVDAFMQNLQNDPEFAQQFEDNEDLWFTAAMFLPATPVDMGVSLNRGVRYVGSLMAPDIIPPYAGIDGPEDIAVRMLEMGPVYSVRLWQTLVNDSNRRNDSGPDFRRLPDSGNSRSGLDAVLGR